MRILGPVVLPLVMAMLDTGHELLLGCLLIPPALDQNIENVAILIYCSPQIMNAPIDAEEHFIEVPIGRPAEETCGVGRWHKPDRT